MILMVRFSHIHVTISMNSMEMGGMKPTEETLSAEDRQAMEAELARLNRFIADDVEGGQAMKQDITEMERRRDELERKLNSKM